MTDNEQDRQRFRLAALALAIATRSPKDVDTGVLKIYWSGLDDLPTDDVVRAAGELAKTSHKFPTLAAWREAATK